MDAGHIGGVHQIDREVPDFVRIGTYRRTSIFTKRLEKYLRDCSAAIDRVERRKDGNVVEDWQKTLAIQCKDDWEGELSIVQHFESFYEVSPSASTVQSQYLQFCLTFNDSRNVEKIVAVQSFQSETIFAVASRVVNFEKIKNHTQTIRYCVTP